MTTGHWLLIFLANEHDPRIWRDMPIRQLLFAFNVPRLVESTVQQTQLNIGPTFQGT